MNAIVFPEYRKIPIRSTGPSIFVQKSFLLGLFSGELIFRGAYYWKEFCVLKWVGLDNKNSLKHYENSLKQLALTVHGLIFGKAYYWKDFASEIWGLIFGRAFPSQLIPNFSRYQGLGKKYSTETIRWPDAPVSPLAQSKLED